MEGDEPMKNTLLADLNAAVAKALAAGLPWIDIEIAIDEARLEHDPYYDGDHD